MLANTPISLHHGYIATLNDLKRTRQGYRVITYNPTEKKQACAYTYGAESKGKKPTLEILLTTYEKVICTGSQLFYTAEGSQIAALDIQPGVKLLSIFGTPMTVLSVKPGKETEVYALQVFEGENFVLCSGGLLTKSA